MSALLDQLRAVSATLRDIDHAPDYIEVDPVAVSALLAEAATALAESERARETLRRERNAAMNERDEARADAERYRQREQHFADALKVADGGQYRADWNGAIQRVLNERDAARAEVARLLRLASGPHINDEGE